MEKQTCKRIPKADLINLLIEFVNIYGREPKRREKYKNVNIGGFLSRIRQNSTVLSAEDKTLLINSGIRITAINKKDIVHEKVLLLVEFFNLYNRTPNRNEIYKNVKFDDFLSNIKRGYTTLSFEDEKLLIDTGIKINSNKKQDDKHKKVLLLVEFYNLYHRQPRRNEVYKNVKLGNFLSNIKRGETTLSFEDKELLIDSGIRITAINKKDIVHRKVLLLVEFYDLYHRTPTQNEIYKNVKLGSFLSNIKRSDTTLSFEDKELLINSGIRITAINKKDIVHEKVLLLIEFFNLYNRLPKRNEVYKNVKLGNFLSNVKWGHTKLSSEDIKLLINTGIKITSNKIQEDIHKKVLLLIEFYHLYNRIPQRNEVYKDVNLGNFIANLKQGHTKLSSEDIKLLIDTGIKITSNKRQEDIHKKVLLLVEFYTLYNRIPKRNEVYKDVHLGNFIANLKRGHKTLSFEDEKLLIDTGIKIDTNKIQDNKHEKVLLLVEFFNLYHRQPKQREIYKGINIGTFLSSIRQGHTALSTEDKTLLIDSGIRITQKKIQDTIHEKVLLLVEFFNLYNRTPKQNEIYKDIKLGTFLMNVRKGYTTLSTEDTELLITTGIRITTNNKKTFKKIKQKS